MASLRDWMPSRWMASSRDHLAGGVFCFFSLDRCLWICFTAICRFVSGSVWPFNEMFLDICILESSQHHSLDFLVAYLPKLATARQRSKQNPKEFHQDISGSGSHCHCNSLPYSNLSMTLQSTVQQFLDSLKLHCCHSMDILQFLFLPLPFPLPNTSEGDLAEAAPWRYQSCPGVASDRA